MPNRRIKSGTCYFTSERAAIRFYRSYGLPADYALQKLALGEIFIGEPPVTGNERAVLVDDGARWAIESDIESDQTAGEAKRAR